MTCLSVRRCRAWLCYAAWGSRRCRPPDLTGWAVALWMNFARFWTARVPFPPPVIDQCPRVIRQTGRFSQLEIKPRANRQGPGQLSPIRLVRMLDESEEFKF